MSVTARKMQMATSGQGSGEEFIYEINTDRLNQRTYARSEAITNGWNESQPLRIKISNADFLGDRSTRGPALDLTGDYPSGLTLQLCSGVRIMGRGGYPIMASGASAANGDEAILIDSDITIELNSADIGTSARSVMVFGGGGAGGSCRHTDRDGSKSFTYDYAYCYGGGGAGGGGTPYQSGLTYMDGGQTRGTEINFSQLSGTVTRATFTASISTSPQGGYGCGFILEDSGEVGDYNYTIYGNTGGTKTPTSNTSGDPSRVYHSTSSVYGYFDVGRSYTYSSALATTVSGGSANTGTKSICGSGSGGGYGGNGGASAAYQNFDPNNTNYYVTTYSAGVGGAAIKKTSGTEVITFTGDLSVGSSTASVVFFLGSYT